MNKKELTLENIDKALEILEEIGKPKNEPYSNLTDIELLEACIMLKRGIKINQEHLKALQEKVLWMNPAFMNKEERELRNEVLGYE